MEARGANPNGGAEAIASAERQADMLTLRAGSGDPSAVPTINRVSAAFRTYPPGMIMQNTCFQSCILEFASNLHLDITILFLQWNGSMAVGVEAADPGLALILDSMRFFLRPGGSPGTVLEDLAKTLNRVQTLRDLMGNCRGLIAAANASRPEYERYALLSLFHILICTVDIPGVTFLMPS